CNKTFCKDYMKENCSDANGKFADENGKGKEGCEIQVTATCFVRNGTSSPSERPLHFSISLMIQNYYRIPTRKSLVDEIKSAIIASLLLGFGSIFLSMAVGVYV
ncbi:17013_t:CDS:2, partial [Gigaspora rosea]